MMKAFKMLIFFKKPHPNWNVGSGLSSYCTKTSVPFKDTIFKRILTVWDYKVSIVPILDRWVQEGRPIDRPELRVLLKLLRNRRRFTHALQLAEWMTKDSELSPGDVAVRLDLISRVRGLEEAERYLSSVSDKLITFKVNGSLLNCYARMRLVEKAESIMQSMKESGCNLELTYNVMLNLYSKLGKHEKFDKLVQEMERNNIDFGKATYCILLDAYAANSNVEAMEKEFKKMENDPRVKLNWNVCCILAKGYLKAGLADKASDMLKKAETLIGGNIGLAYRFLISMYASLGDKHEVIRIWHLYKNRGNVGNTGYYYMMGSFIRLDDINEAEKIFQEWESVNTTYDFRVLNTLINAYTKKGLLPKAEALVNRAVDSGRKVPASTWDHLATGYYKDNQMDNAVDTMKKAIGSPKHHGWILNRDTLTACFEYLKGKGDPKQEEFAKVLKERDIVREELAEKHENGSSDIGVFDEIENDEEVDLLSLGSKKC